MNAAAKESESIKELQNGEETATQYDQLNQARDIDFLVQAGDQDAHLEGVTHWLTGKADVTTERVEPTLISALKVSDDSRTQIGRAYQVPVKDEGKGDIFILLCFLGFYTVVVAPAAVMIHHLS